MANYINLTLDTAAPSGVSVIINSGEAKTSSTAVTLAISCSDIDTTDYQMKIWGISGAETEDSASWETFSDSKSVTLPTGDGVKNVYVKVRDDVWNESAAASDTISLYTSVPTVSVKYISGAKFSLVSGKDSVYGEFSYDEDISAVKLMLVQDANASHDNASNISIPTANGSCMTDVNTSSPYSCDTLEYEIDVESAYPMEFTINAADINAVSPGDGVKIVKAFVRSAASGNWSV